MTTLIFVDETSGTQNVQTGVTSNDTSAPLPLRFQDALAAESAGTGTVQAVALSGVDGTLANAGGVEVLTLSQPAIDIAFVDAGGDPFNGTDSLLTTTSGSRILLYTSSFDDNVLIGRNEDTNAVVFAAFLDTGVDPATGDEDVGATGAKLWLMQFSPMHHGDPNDPNDIVLLEDLLNVLVTSPTSFSLAGSPSGQNLFLMVGDGTPTADEVTLVITGRSPVDQSSGKSINSGDTVNTSQAGDVNSVGTNNQMIDKGEGVYLTFVKGANTNYTVPNLDQNEADVEANIDFASYFGVMGASFVATQLQPGKLATISLSAFNNTDTSEVGVSFINGLGDSDDAAVNIGAVTVTRTVFDGTAYVTTSYTFTEALNTSQAGLTVSFAGTKAVITGVLQGDKIAYATDSGHNRVLIENPGGATRDLSSSFDIGQFALAGSEGQVAPLGDLGFVDDAPIADAALGTGTVTHDETSGVDSDADDTTSATVAALFAGVTTTSTQMTAGYAQGSASVVDSTASDGGADTLASTSYSLDVSAAGVDSGLDSVEGNDILLYKEGDLVVGRISGGADDGEAAFAVAINAATGVLSVAQYHAIEHADATDPDDSASISNAALLAVVTVTDGDGDTDTDSVAIGAAVSFEDDGPSAFAPASTTLSNTGSASGGASLNTAGTIGVDLTGDCKFVDNYAANNYLYASDGVTQLTSGGEKIVLSGYGTGTLTAKTETSLATVFVATINFAGDAYTIAFSRPIDDGSGTSLLGAAPLKSGNPLYNMLDNVGATDLDVLFSGATNGTQSSVNVSTQGAGTGNQTMNPGELLRLDFGNNVALAGSPNGSDFVPGTHETVNNFEFLLSQNTPSGTTGTVYITAWDADDDKVLSGDPGDVQDTVDLVKVNGTVVYDGTTHSATINGQTVTAIVYAGGIVLTGLNEGASGDGAGGDDPMILVATADGFNRIEVSNYAGKTVNSVVLGGTSFDIAPAGILQDVAGDPVSFNLPVQTIDQDGDLSPVELIGVTVNPV